MKRKYSPFSTYFNQFYVSLIITVIVYLTFIPSFGQCFVRPSGYHPGQTANSIIGEHVKPPMLTMSHIRVSRDPLLERSYLQTPAEDSTGRINNFIKSPSYQHKMLHASQFHGNNNPTYHNPFGEYISNNPTYPVASVHMKGDLLRRPNNHLVELSPEETFINGGSGTGIEDDLYPYEESLQNPTFSPYIGPRALSSIPEFFTHIRDNLNALRELERQEEEQALKTSGEDDDRKLHHSPHEKDLPIRRGDYFQSDGRLSINSDEYGYAYHGNGNKGSEIKSGNRAKLAEEATSDLLNYMGQDPKYKKANGYNPGWLFTGLGLGKRSSRPTLSV